jgi:hypothetical protein
MGLSVAVMGSSDEKHAGHLGLGDAYGTRIGSRLESFTLFPMSYLRPIDQISIDQPWPSTLRSAIVAASQNQTWGFFRLERDGQFQTLNSIASSSNITRVVLTGAYQGVQAWGLSENQDSQFSNMIALTGTPVYLRGVAPQEPGTYPFTLKGYDIRGSTWGNPLSLRLVVRAPRYLPSILAPSFYRRVRVQAYRYLP